MIWVMNERREDNGENHGLNDLAHRLREAVSRPLDEWREVYEGFSPVDLETGERRPGCRRLALTRGVRPFWFRSS